MRIWLAMFAASAAAAAATGPGKLCCTTLFLQYIVLKCQLTAGYRYHFELGNKLKWSNLLSGLKWGL